MSIVGGVNQDQLFNALMKACEDHGAGVPGWYVPAEARSNLHFAVVAMTTFNGFAGAAIEPVTVVHMADDPDPDRTAGTACGLFLFGADSAYDADVDAITTVAAEVTCRECSGGYVRADAWDRRANAFDRDAPGGGPDTRHPES